MPPTSPLAEKHLPVLALPHPLFLEHAWTPVGPQLNSRCSSETRAKGLSLFLFWLSGPEPWHRLIQRTSSCGGDCGLSSGDILACQGRFLLARGLLGENL
ncbi:hypothetical protein GX48_03671 [Paracoccidioides brasiliensis]|nr:hypothetical protein GX48_03671 [Paracoccidioides brasiliensis]